MTEKQSEKIASVQGSVRASGRAPSAQEPSVDEAAELEARRKALMKGFATSSFHRSEGSVKKSQRSQQQIEVEPEEAAAEESGMRMSGVPLGSIE